ncbi:hypothetical protein JD844_005924 [Phrynosoma platyrhinos]|uniref:Centrosomal protein CCDC61 n=1 Tax=Phrynosoma platyrhinos TaxID=52577 RepID=A0ABQ7TQ99_PHRPL|nr:hypothetical protein JD844_005924 [Phrynosoma platyrhinos]
MAKLHGLQADYVFRGVEHIVRMTVEGNLLEVEVEDRLTTDQWRGEFDAAFIEDLTHKTGNFKQFGIFCNMLESALAQVQLLLIAWKAPVFGLTTITISSGGFWPSNPKDLEALRNRKIGVGPRHLSATKSSPLSSKRYLILIYSVEFDRIHYPLPLPYVGKPDPVVLQKVIRELKEELALLKAKPGKDFRDAEIRRLREELQNALEEKQAVETALLGLQEELKLANKSSALKEVKILKKVVQSLEEELTKERAKHQRVSSKRLQESQQLAEEMAEMKATERSLRIRVKNLTNELALYRKGRFTPTGPSPQNQSTSSRHFRQPALTRGGTKKREDHCSTSRERSNSRERSGVWGPSRQRSTSREGRSGSQGRIPRQSPSPTGTRGPRFDPTAFVKAKERKQKEAEQKNDASDEGWEIPHQVGGTTVPNLGVPRLSTTAALGKPGAGVPQGPEASGKGQETLEFLVLEWPHHENLYDEPSADLSEIDARLQALQEYMNKLETRT